MNAFILEGGSNLISFLSFYRFFQMMKSTFSEMPITDALLIFTFGICGHSFDVYSDLAFIIKLIGFGNTNIALAIACTMISSTLFTLPHWWEMEKTFDKRILTFPFIILQFYKQYKMFQILYFGLWKKDCNWRQKKS